MDTQREEEGLALMQHSMAILEELGGHEEDVATGLLNQAYYYAGKDQDQKAMDLLMKSIRMFSALSYQKSAHDFCQNAVRTASGASGQ